MADLDLYFKQLDEAYASNDIKKINEINNILMGEIGVKIGETSLDFDFVENIRGKAVFKNLSLLIKGKEFTLSETAKLLSSLATHMIIECDVRDLSYNTFPIRNLLGMAENVLYNDGYDRGEVVEYLKGRYGKFVF